jgi:hypothetical protein
MFPSQRGTRPAFQPRKAWAEGSKSAQDVTSGSSFFTKPLFALRAQRELIGKLMPCCARSKSGIGWHGLLLAAGIAIVVFGSRPEAATRRASGR